MPSRLLDQPVAAKTLARSIPAEMLGGLSSADARRAPHNRPPPHHTTAGASTVDPAPQRAGHVAPRQVISINGEPAEVNSYHNFGATETRPPLEAWAFAEDGVVKAVRHTTERMMGIMWHPERLSPFASRDISLFQQFFGSP